MACHSSKRPRELEEITAYNEDTSRDTKKHRPLPLRSSPRSSQRLKIAETVKPIFFSALTPVDSSEDEDVFSKRFRTELDKANAQQPQNFYAPKQELDASMDIDTCEDIEDMDQDKFSPSPIAGFDNGISQSLHNPYDVTCQPPSAGNIPPLPGARDSLSRTKCLFQSDDSLCPSELLRGTTWRSPRLPSPVSDNGDIRGKDATGDTEMADDTPSQHSPPVMNSAAAEAEAADMRKRLSSLDLPDQGNVEPTSSVKSTKKLAFSMGYRADCDKCRRRVPGHYSHIIRG
ncbi:hypothetical protein BJX68DRAFT_227073 [Aspergillus pseudodeflectus]|uniref:Uncharacterized protein n=1 Tax=Aspergillus pseudodeflectus TaxID=176178 RepID=A0ABR4L2X6_9EURO